MAKLIPPQTATRFKVSEDAKWSKWYLLRRGNAENLNDLSVCGKILAHNPNPKYQYPLKEDANISDIDSSDLCRKCLGAMVAED
jgi:hypothetical protein